MRHEVRESDTLRITVPAQNDEISFDVRVIRIRGGKAEVMLESRNWRVQSEVVHPKRSRGGKSRPKFVDGGRIDSLD